MLHPSAYTCATDNLPASITISTVRVPKTDELMTREGVRNRIVSLRTSHTPLQLRHLRSCRRWSDLVRLPVPVPSLVHPLTSLLTHLRTHFTYINGDVLTIESPLATISGFLPWIGIHDIALELVPRRVFYPVNFSRTFCVTRFCMCLCCL